MTSRYNFGFLDPKRQAFLYNPSGLVYIDLDLWDMIRSAEMSPKAGTRDTAESEQKTDRNKPIN